MKMLLCFLFAVSFSVNAAAAPQQVESKEFLSQVQLADCSEVARSGSTTGALTGGAVGAGAGAVVGGWLFGKTGAAIGGLVGGGAGGVAGENLLANVTWTCVLQFSTPEGKRLFLQTLGPRYLTGQQLRVYKTESGYSAVPVR